MKKAILKAKLSSRDRFEAKLSEIDLDFSPVFWQHDRLYVPRNYQPNRNFPRLTVRTEIKAIDRPPQYFLVLKRHIEDSSLDIVEISNVRDYESVVNIILQLGFKPLAEISRRRQSLNLSSETTIFLDQIDSLPGYYAKIETTLTPDEPVAAARSELEQTFSSLGEKNFIVKPYFEL